MTLTPGEHLPSLKIGEIMVDKLLHFGVFLVLSFLAYMGIRYGAPEDDGDKRGLRILAYCVLYGTVVEGLQYWVPGRNIDLLDLIANLLGCLGGMLLYRGYQKVVGSLEKK
ncbi:MAG: VanZ family protein [Cyclobacteriaceae bacterium]